MNHHHSGGVDVLAVLGLTAALALLLAYAVLLERVHRRGRTWPVWRTLAWTSGCLLATAAVAGPLAAAAMSSWTAHMAGHVLLGMLAPLLLVIGAPVTLALNALPVRTARRLSRLLRSRPSRVLTEPAVAAVLDVGGLWLLYGTPLLAVAHDRPWLDVVVHAHVLLAGYLFAAVLVGSDPLPHRRRTRHLLVVLVLALAAHDVLAKRLYAAAGGTDLLDHQHGALLMYYGGDAVDLVLAVLVCARWYRRSGSRVPPSGGVLPAPGEFWPVSRGQNPPAVPRHASSGQAQLDLERTRARPQGVLGQHVHAARPAPDAVHRVVQEQERGLRRR